MEIRALVDDNGEGYYNAKDITRAMIAESKSLVLIDANLIRFVKRFIGQLITA